MSIKIRSWVSSMLKFVYFEDGEYSDYNKVAGGPIFYWDKAECCTNLVDKNGVEIYEGDIVKDKRGLSESLGVIEYDNTNGRFTYSGWNIPSYHEKFLEVVGNIYENKDLLK